MVILKIYKSHPFLPAFTFLNLDFYFYWSKNFKGFEISNYKTNNLIFRIFL